MHASSPDRALLGPHWAIPERLFRGHVRARGRTRAVSLRGPRSDDCVASRGMPELRRAFHGTHGPQMPKGRAAFYRLCQKALIDQRNVALDSFGSDRRIKWGQAWAGSDSQPLTCTLHVSGGCMNQLSHTHHRTQASAAWKNGPPKRPAKPAAPKPGPVTTQENRRPPVRST